MTCQETLPLAPVLPCHVCLISWDHVCPKEEVSFFPRLLSKESASGSSLPSSRDTECYGQRKINTCHSKPLFPVTSRHLVLVSYCRARSVSFLISSSSFLPFPKLETCMMMSHWNWLKIVSVKQKHHPGLHCATACPRISPSILPAWHMKGPTECLPSSSARHRRQKGRKVVIVRDF